VFDLKKAALAQERLTSRLKLSCRGENIRLFAGADCSYDSERKQVGAVVVVLEMPGLSVVEVCRDVQKEVIPYIPGYLNFREGPVLLKTFRKLKLRPDVTLIDGNGIAHPRKMGLASYVGVILDISTVGCAKTAFFPFDPPGKEKGAFTELKNEQEEKVGLCLRTRTGVKPVFVSPGHRMDFSTAKQCVLMCSKYRIPEPLRRAHVLAKDLFC
jgi:deoxyribonuclease V